MPSFHHLSLIDGMASSDKVSVQKPHPQQKHMGFCCYCNVYNKMRWFSLAYPEAILGLGLKSRPNVGFKLRNNTSCCIHLLFSPKTKTKSLRTEYIILTQYMTNDGYIDRYSTLPGKGVYYGQQNST